MIDQNQMYLLAAMVVSQSLAEAIPQSMAATAAPAAVHSGLQAHQNVYERLGRPPAIRSAQLLLNVKA